MRVSVVGVALVGLGLLITTGYLVAARFDLVLEFWLYCASVVVLSLASAMAK